MHAFLNFYTYPGLGSLYQYGNMDISYDIFVVAFKYNYSCLKYYCNVDSCLN